MFPMPRRLWPNVCFWIVARHSEAIRLLPKHLHREKLREDAENW